MYVSMLTVLNRQAAEQMLGANTQQHLSANTQLCSIHRVRILQVSAERAYWWGFANIFDASLTLSNVHACPIFITHLCLQQKVAAQFARTPLC